MSVQAPPRVWWRPVSRDERLYFGAATLFAVGTWVLMAVWHFIGPQNVEMQSYRVDPATYVAKTEAFAKQYQVGQERQFQAGAEVNVPIVDPPPGGDIYLLAKTYQWYPILKLKRGQTYRLHLSSADLQHGFSVLPINMNFMVIPGYEYILTLTPTERGNYGVICNEFCGLGHHLMAGKIIVE